MPRTTLNRVEEEKGEEAKVISPEDGANLSPLHLAAIMGNKSKMAALLKEHKDDIDKGDKIGRTPLIYSILGDRYECAEALIKAGADINQTDVDERTALHWAAYQGNQKFVKLLLDKGAQQGSQDKEGRTPLHLSLSHDNIKVMSRLLKDTDVDCRDGTGMTPLHFSVAYERVEHTKMLLHAKASPDCQDNDKKTVLHWAKSNKDTTIVSKLLDYERVMLILNSKDSEGRTALHLMVAVDNRKLVRYLTSREDCLLSEQDHMQRTPLHLAAILGHTEIASVLLARGCEPLKPDNNGVRPLHYAAQNNCGKTVDAMLQHDNVTDVPDDDGRTALMWAAAKGANEALSVLIQHKQDILASDRSTATALHMACEGGHLQCVSLLLQNQADVNALDKQKYTPLFCACQMGQRDVVETLLLHGATVDLEDKEDGATVDLEDKEGRTPLHWAAVGGRTDICGMLLDHGLDISRRDKLGRPALHYAAYGGFYSCMSLLLEFGADVDTRDKTGVTALHWACASGSLDAVKLLFRYNAFPNFVEMEGDKLTPLDYAIIREHQDVAQFMIEQGAFTIAGIQDEAATVIQATWRGYRLRKYFQEQKELLILHERKRRETKKSYLTDNEELEFENDQDFPEEGVEFSNSLNLLNGRDFADYFGTPASRLDEEVVNDKDNDGSSRDGSRLVKNEARDIENETLNIENEASDFENEAPNLGYEPQNDADSGQHELLDERRSVIGYDNEDVASDRGGSSLGGSFILRENLEESQKDISTDQPQRHKSFEATEVSRKISNGNLKEDFVPKLTNPITKNDSGKDCSRDHVQSRSERIFGLKSDELDSSSNTDESAGSGENKRLRERVNSIEGKDHSDISLVPAQITSDVKHTTVAHDKRENVDFGETNFTKEQRPRVGSGRAMQLVEEAGQNRPNTSEKNSYMQTKRHKITKLERSARIDRSPSQSRMSVNDYNSESASDLKPWQIYKRERHRKNLIRRKMESAVIIQRAFRTHILRHKPRFAEQMNEEEREKEAKAKEVVQDIAALVIQLHWRKYLKRKLVQERRNESRRKDSADLRLLAARERKPKVILHPRSPPESTRRKSHHASKQRLKTADVNTTRTTPEQLELPNINNRKVRIDETYSVKKRRDPLNEVQPKSRPKTVGAVSKRGSRSGQKISPPPAKPHRNSDAHSKVANNAPQGSSTAFKMYMPQNWSSNLQKFPLRY